LLVFQVDGGIEVRHLLSIGRLDDKIIFTSVSEVSYFWKKKKKQREENIRLNLLFKHKTIK
jgi:hypothetical protein